MFKRKPIRTLLILTLAAGAALFSGCKHYRTEVVVNPDGSGTRSVTLSVQGGPDNALSADSPEFRQIFGVTAEKGWQRISAPGDAPGKTRPGYRLESTVAEVSAWSAHSGDIHILGTLDPDHRDDMQFTNRVSLEWEETPESPSLTYRETFAWTGLLEYFVAFHTRGLERGLATSYPELTPEEQAELRGLFSGVFTTWLMQLEVGEDPEIETGDLERSFHTLARGVLRDNHPEMDFDGFAEVVHDVFENTADELDAHVEAHFPGAHETVFSDIEIHLTLPGRIINTNADEVDGNTAVWTVNIWDALARPVEIKARSVLTP